MSKPLLTFFVCAYNQEQFIREAVEGALAQTYTPLEIILSDDCSPDRTFDIMREMASAYRGPNQVILNRNEKNLRMAGHLNRIISMARGEILLCAAGDDISFKNRADRIFDTWVQSAGKAFSIYSSMIEIDVSGAQKGLWNNGSPIHATSASQMVGRFRTGVYGFSHAFHRKVFDTFGPLDNHVIYEDVTIPFRSLLLGNIAFIPEALGYYRRHDSNIWPDHTILPTLETRRQVLRANRAGFVTWLNDLRRASLMGILSREESEKLQAEVIARLYESELESRFYESPLPGSLSVFAREYLRPGKIKHLLRIAKRSWQSQTARRPKPITPNASNPAPSSLPPAHTNTDERATQ